MAVLIHTSFYVCSISIISRICALLPILVQQVCRHGDRSPTHFFPNNVNKDKWTQGEGYLTPLGESQLYENGKSFRSSWYPGLLSEVVYPSESKVISSNKDRAIMSTNAFLAALFPPTAEYVFEKGLNWQAFPTHAISKEIDYYIHGTTCPALDDELEKLHDSENYTTFVTENQNFINEICSEAGYSPSEWTVKSLGRVYSNLFCDMAHNFSIPSWVTDDNYTRMRNIVTKDKHFEYSDRKVNHSDTGGGPLLGLIVNNMMGKVANNLTQKFIYYSGHDSTVFPFLGNLDQPVGPKPPYASCAFLELYKSSSNNNYQVQLLFMNTTESQMQQPRLIPGCDIMKCDLDTFLKVTKDKVNKDPQTACYDVTQESGSGTSKGKQRICEVVMTWLTLAVIFILLKKSSIALPKRVLKVCRHGDRSPSHFFPNNVNKDKWPQGKGYLTPLGESQLYENGKSFRKLWYPGLLSDVVYPTEIKVISSESGRCIMSANAFLAALYPPTGEYVFEKDLNWQAFPTHTISSEIDYYLYGTTCPAWDEELDRLHSSENYTTFLKDNQDFINQTCSNAGYPPSAWNMQSFEYVYDNIICDCSHNFSIPSWLTDDVYNRIRDIMNLEKQLQFTDQKANYLDTGGGPLLGLMMNNIMEKMANNLTQKFFYYSAHESTVLPFMGSLDRPVGPKPPYASCAFLELYQSSQNKYQVQLLFLNTTEGQMQQPRMIPGCDAIKCDLDMFLIATRDKVNLDPQTACYDVTQKKEAKSSISEHDPKSSAF